MGLDVIRGLSVALMLMFHFVYDLWLFGHVGPEYRQGFWFMLPRFIVFLFLWCVGASLVLTHGEKIKWASYKKRLLKLALIALVISVATYIAFPANWIYFGTIHCIAVVSILALPFLRFPRLSLPIMLMIMTAQYGLGYDLKWVSKIIPKPAMDFIPFYPWFWVTLLGMITGRWVLERWPQFLNLNPLAFLGRHALKIYLSHQVVFYAIFSLVKLLSAR
jgi:uncharacterized membrane protein